MTVLTLIADRTPLAVVEVSTVTYFLAILAVGALACTVVILVVVVDATVGSRNELLREVRRDLAISGWWLALLTAVVATAGSLYLSEVAGFVPCELCWYQRIAMYPLVIVLGVAAVRDDRGARFTVLPIALIGASISAYHYVLQLFPDSGGACDPTAPCTVRYIWEFGFVSIPFMAGCAFVLIAALTVAATSRGMRHSSEPRPRKSRIASR